MTLIEILNLFDDRHIPIIKDRIERGIPDIRKVLYECKATNYLEIGVRKGMSMAVVAAKNPRCTITGIDMWIPEYDGGNPGPDYVRKMVKKVGYKKTLKLLSGSSHDILPTLEGFYDLILIDGDHSYEGALQDLRDCIALSNGLILLDDLQDPEVMKSWEQIQKEFPNAIYQQEGDIGWVR